MLGRGSSPVPNMAAGAHIGAVWPLPPSDLKVIGLSTLPILGFVFIVRRGRPLSLQVYAKKEKMRKSERNLDLKWDRSQYIYKFSNSRAVEGLLPVKVLQRWS